MKKGQQLLDEHNVMRLVPSQRLRRDGDDNILGFLPQAFQLRPQEQGLSVNWLEHFDGDHSTQVASCIKAIRIHLDVRKKSAFGIANVRKVKEICNTKSRTIRIVYAPSDGNESHTVIQKLPADDMELLDALAIEAFTELVLNTDVPL